MEKVLSGYVGFGNLPNQVYKKSVSNGFDFTLMVVGASGLGKSTLINSLFCSEIYAAGRQLHNIEIFKTTKIESTKLHIYENDINLTLNLVDTPGFSDFVDNTNCWEPIVTYIHDMFEDYYENESKICRSFFDDKRVHCCLYFISTNGRGLKDLDVSFMKALHEKVNLIPIIAKADSFSHDELMRYKQQLLKDIRDNSIKIYDFTNNNAGFNEHDVTINRKFYENLPFGVVGSNHVVEADGKIIHGRKYPWGIVDINDSEHCDFLLLKDVLIRFHMQNMKDLIHTKLYENFRRNQLSGIAPTHTHLLPDIQVKEEDLDTNYNSKYVNLLTQHKSCIDSLKLNISYFQKELELQKQAFDSQQAEYIEEKKVFEEDHVNFVISVTETGRTGSIGGKRTAKKTKN